jgi:hypothetical protein
MLEREKGILPCKSIKGGLLCDDPGLGKTIQTCSTIYYADPKKNSYNFTSEYSKSMDKRIIMYFTCVCERYVYSGTLFSLRKRRS